MIYDEKNSNGNSTAHYPGGKRIRRNGCKRLRVYTIVDFSFIRTFAPSF